MKRNIYGTYEEEYMVLFVQTRRGNNDKCYLLVAILGVYPFTVMEVAFLIPKKLNK